MTERELGSRYLKRYQKEHPRAFVYRIPDSMYSGRKPFDAFIVENGLFTAIEFKMEGRRLEPHQEYELEKIVSNGGIAKVVYFGKKGEIKEVIL